MKILIAEDEPIMLRTIDLRLKKDGHETYLAEDGQSALEKITDISPDLIITDIMMPYASGLEIIGFVRGQQAKKTPIIILSAVSQREAVVRAFQSGVKSYLIKPLKPDQILRKTLEILKANF